MLMPKKVKYRKQQRGRMTGKAWRGSQLAFGDFGLKVLEPGWITDRQIEASRVAMVVFTLGYSHPIEYPLPSGIDVAVDPKQTKLTVSGIDRQKVGQVSAEMRALRPPDPYKNKGVRYVGERLKKKVGKTGAK